MAFGDSDLGVFLTDFGVPVVYGATNARGILRIYDQGNPAPDADNSSIGRWVQLLVKTGSLPGLSQETPITIDGVAFYVHTFSRMHDGAFTQLDCQAVPVTVQPVATMSIATPPTVTYLPLQLMLTMADALGNAIDPATRFVTWGSQNPLIAKVSQSGIVTAVAAGTTDIVATCEGREVRVTVTVQALAFSVVVTPPTFTLFHGGTQQLAVVTKDVNGTVITGRTATYTPADPTIATVNSTGLVTAVGVGSTTIVVTVDGVSTTVSVTGLAAYAVNSVTVTPSPFSLLLPMPVATVLVTPTPVTIMTGSTQQLTTVEKDILGNVLTGRVVTFASSAPSVATVSSTGLVTGIAGGTATITATSEGVNSAGDVVTVTVDDVAALVTALGGNASVAAFYDVRRNVTLNGSTVSAWDDARGTSGFGPQIAQATGANQPAWTGGADSAKLMTFDGSTSKMATALSTLFDANAGVTLVMVGAMNAGSGNTYYAGITESGGIARGFAPRADATVHYGIQSFNGGGQVGTAVLAGTAIRLSLYAASGTNQYVEVPSQAQASSANGAIASGSNALTLGTYWITGGVGCPLTLRAVLVLPGVYTAAQRASLATWATTYHAAVLA